MSLARAQARFDLMANPDPVSRAIASIATGESDNVRWLRERSDLIAKLHAEMIAEREAEAAERDDAGFNETNATQELDR